MKTGHALRNTWWILTQEAGVTELDAKIIMNHAIPGANAGFLSRSVSCPHLLAVQEEMSTFIMEQCL